ncbi:TDP-N-acetylfucosamine:lipid II N-acetylfucosaminyltransferase [Pantoea stewartii]|uniref:TDP-N-acetylfucosamine:lipid II N-acetylfucosaminyltransferase n=1 Tax=Pantoea stewartii TaxID=66269 RepID=UPI001624314C|nr:TDP-N-acetylfucosamine:lipid II N-acetylfucosaminyltransferase [Pantoea stewartii]MBC0855820.1 TDP-N-acetylfucosamine:lipid II N-acetylfucosaminyltransferase [Pantoea stewartii]
MTLIHVLGSDIPHHNLTVLRFFNDVMSTELPAPVARHFMVVTRQPESLIGFDALRIETFSSKKALSEALLRRAKQREQRFFCHGQFNPWLWLALLSGRLHRSQVYWHVWGADLYEDSRSLKFRLFYFLRRIAQGRIARVFATEGDLYHYQQRHPSVPRTLLYFPTRLPTAAITPRPDDILTVLLGNSGDASNRHTEGLEAIRAQFGQNVRIAVPLGYPPNNDEYIARIQNAADRLFPQGQVTLLRENLAFDDYLALLARCHLGYFMFERQQGVGTLCLLIQANIPFVLTRKNSFWRDVTAQQLPVLFSDDALTPAIVAEARRQLMGCDKQHVAFLAPGYLVGWQAALRLCEGEPS